MSFSSAFLDEAAEVSARIDHSTIEKAVTILSQSRAQGGRLFIIGSGGGAGHASHAVCDFRKLCNFEAYCPTDNISELTARVNDEGWDTCIANYLRGSRISAKDSLLVFSVGGGNEQQKISVNLVEAIKVAKDVGASIVGVVGRDGGYTAQVADACVIIPTVSSAHTTPHTEAFQAVVWHLMVSHPLLQVNTAKWESTEKHEAADRDIAATEIHEFQVKIFADGADVAGMLEMYRNPHISGFTTNPTLMKKAGITDYELFSKEILALIKDRPISLEVFSDSFDEMEAQAREIATWGRNVYVKIPITNTSGESSAPLIERLSNAGIKVNVTAIMTIQQVYEVLPALKNSPGAYVSIFAGRIADTGRDPLPVMKQAVRTLSSHPNIELIWASPRELLNIVQANEIGCHVITVTNDILKKLSTIGKNLDQFSLETVEMFYNDACSAGFKLAVQATQTSSSAPFEVAQKSL